jgi:hypothetical protein
VQVFARRFDVDDILDCRQSESACPYTPFTPAMLHTSAASMRRRRRRRTSGRKWTVCAPRRPLQMPVDRMSSRLRFGTCSYACGTCRKSAKAMCSRSGSGCFRETTSLRKQPVERRPECCRPMRRQDKTGHDGVVQPHVRPDTGTPHAGRPAGRLRHRFRNLNTGSLRGTRPGTDHSRPRMAPAGYPQDTHKEPNP